MHIPNYFENMDVLHLNTMPTRSYYIPAGKPMGALVTDRERSDRFQLLNGDWKFRYHESVHMLQEEFFAEGYDASGFDTIAVPGVWQSYGYDRQQYTNTRFPFPYDPPYVPYENPCGTDIHTFTYTPDAAAPRAYLNFEGVDSWFYVWLNGSFVGYSQVSHSTSEFDVTHLLRSGENTLAVLVLKWCDGSYLEDQDKFRHTGIFRDVFLLKRPENHLWDYFVTTDGGKIRVRMSGHALVKLYDQAHTLLAETTPITSADAEFPLEALLEVEKPIFWNPEAPYLYTLEFHTPGEVITDRVGLRAISIINNVVLLNGQPIKFRGINRHDSDPVVGPAVDLDHIQNDMAMFKQFNFNAIRTSHYPNAPQFYQLCDEYGFMVIDEADNESHGCRKLYGVESAEKDTRHRKWATPQANNPAFTGVILDRVQLCVRRDKNRPCVLIWSMGNECAFGCTFETALTWTKQYDPSRLTHYESALYRDNTVKPDFSNLDLYSYMYAGFDVMEDYFANSPDKPFILCEYAHAMGNGPGDFEDYWEVIQAHEGFCGAFVWEWCDHAIYKGEQNGKAMYWYGGDHGEFPHDDNFCVDGLVYPDRTPSTGLWEYWNVHRPARAAWENGVLRLHNYMDFISLEQYLTASWELRCNGIVIGSGQLTVPAIAPHGEGKIPLPLELPQGKCSLRVIYASLQDHPLCEAGHPLGFDDLILTEGCPSAQRLLEMTYPGVPAWEEDHRYITIKSEQFAYRLDKWTGLWASLEYMGKALLEHPMELNLWRAPTDNDRKIRHVWTEAGYQHSVTRCYETRVAAAENALQIICTCSIAPIWRQRIMNIETIWEVDAIGNITASIRVSKDPEFPELPRFGLRLFLPKEMEQVSYLGYGPMESYRDKHRAGWYGKFSSTVTDLHEDYIKPQENGSHWGCDLVELHGGDLSLCVVAAAPFSFNASHYTQEELTAKKHNYEIEESGHTVLCLDYAQTGIGSGSCGPHTLPKHRFSETEFTFTLRLLPGAE